MVRAGRMQETMMSGGEQFESFFSHLTRGEVAALPPLRVVIVF